MFRDRDEELDRLEAALQEAEEEEEFSEEEEYEEEDDEEDVEDDLPDFDAYNSDVTDEDLEEFSDAVYEGGKKSRLGLLAFMLAMLCILLFALALCLLKYGGYLG